MRKSPYVIAEAGSNHNGEWELARDLIDAAATAGADAVKFQIWQSEEFLSDTANVEYGKKLQFQKSEWRKLAEVAAQKGIDFIASVFDANSLKLYTQLKPKFIKIASCDITHTELIDTAAKAEIPMLLSTGMATAAEIEQAVATVRQHHDNLILLHCVSSYPLSIQEANLNAIQTLQQRFDTPVGYSDHTIEIETAALAVILGACVIEKHFTLDRTAPGPDQAHSLNPDEFNKMTSLVDAANRSLGEGELGVATAERDSRYSMRRGLRTRSAISAGASIERINLKITRPEEGVRADELPDVIGKVAVRDIGANEPLVWDDID